MEVLEPKMPKFRVIILTKSCLKSIKNKNLILFRGYLMLNQWTIFNIKRTTIKFIGFIICSCHAKFKLRAILAKV